MMDEDTARMVLGDETATALQEALTGLIMGTKRLVIESEFRTPSGKKCTFNNAVSVRHTFRLMDATG